MSIPNGRALILYNAREIYGPAAILPFMDADTCLTRYGRQSTLYASECLSSATCWRNSHLKMPKRLVSWSSLTCPRL